MCEQTFSVMNVTKSKQQATLTDEHLEDILKTSTTSMGSEYEKLIVDKKCNVSLITGKHTNLYCLAAVTFFINVTKGMIKVN